MAIGANIQMNEVFDMNIKERSRLICNWCGHGKSKHLNYGDINFDTGCTVEDCDCGEYE